MTRASVDSSACWVVVFAGARDSYQVPVALHQAGLLNTLVTDYYCSLDRRFAATLCSLLPSSILSKVKRRFHSALPSTLVDSHPSYAIANWLHPDEWTKRVHLLGHKAGSLAAKERCSIVAYSHVATGAFARAGSFAKVLMQVQPHPAAVKKALTSDLLVPEFQDRMGNELTWPREVFQTFAREPLLANLCVAASNYTRETLIQNGVESECVAVIPYGVDVDFFSPGHNDSNKFSVLFVGQIARQKGVHYLLEAWRRLNFSDAELRIVTHSPSPRESLSPYASQQVTFVGALEWAALRNEYRSADLLCLPSLSEGFGLVALEAMSCGTPVLTTSACGASDLIQEARNGFVVPPADLDALMARLEWASHNRETLREMRVAARTTAEQYPWTRFRNALVKAVQSIDIR